MLKLRIITALVIAPIVIALIFLAPGWLFTGVMLVMALVGAWEWSALAGRPARAARIEMAGLFLVVIALFVLVQPRGAYLQGMVVYCVVALAWWIFSMIWIARLRTEFSVPVKIFCGVLTLLPSLAAVVAIRATNPWYLLILLLLTSAADIGAYFTGRAFGRHKLAPLVSPSKTWEGVVGGVVLVAVVAGVACYWLPVPWWLFVPLCIGVALLSVVGDLSESLFKRQAGIKDSGNFFPGHGGVLDRVDSLTAAAPLYWLGLFGLGLIS